MNTGIPIYFLIDPNKLVPTEEVDDIHVVGLEQKILRHGVWTDPIYVHKSAFFVMDGHHRLMVAKRLQLDVIPVLFSDYDTVEVSAWRPGEIITPHSIFEMARAGNKFPVKTTRHIFNGPKPECAVPLDDLKFRRSKSWAPAPFDGAGFIMTSQ
ncbi:ParB N-terminal domain-containing protein [Agrobacterium vitis]|uniref:ParB N-terminal domain-containing protein n=1 Tax=Agrobacterium vitis TaxID=373 RepID=UPI000871BC78|nr:ParB N-terminal domain-containing protein [Agrobacterium vitis]MCE6076938.1 hypothetical protein [Agrobacterium vitis]MCF1454968.1 hypothetical protein [Agrobacterium vitis]MCF1469320.1 hypothetical protein [Agrobacterium vitis]MCM2449686.1 ParB N-terminal domain-containing protein [Agrobacterium vitis]MUO71741.1 hypothetical protein [Agrobacterium vitis]